MARFQSREEYERWRAGQQGDADPRPAADAAPAEGDQVYDGPAPGSAEFANRSRQQAGLSTDRDRTLAMWCHFTALAGFFFPFGNIIGPAIVWSIGKSGSQFVDEHGKSSLNFQISLTLFFVAGILLFFFIGPLAIVLTLVAGIVVVYGVIMAIVNGIRAHNGEDGEYALSSRFLS